MSVWVVNTSPLVFLGNLGRLELLQQEGREVCIPLLAMGFRANPRLVAAVLQSAGE